MPNDADKRLKVFISYAREDLAFADQIHAALEATGFEPLMDRHNLDAGGDYLARLGRLILESDSIVFMLSPQSVRPQAATLWEVGEAVRLSKRILPIVIQSLGDAHVPDQLSRLEYIFFYPESQFPGSGFGHGFARLLTALNTDVDWLREHTRLLALASDWRQSRHDEQLLRGHLIEDAQRWLAAKPRTAPDVTPLHLEFIKASEDAQAVRDSEARQQLERIAAAQAEREKALARAEEAVRERELALAESLRAQAETQRARQYAAHWRRILAAGAIAAAALIGGIGWQYWKINEELRAERENQKIIVASQDAAQPSPIPAPAPEQAADATSKLRELEVALVEAERQRTAAEEQLKTLKDAYSQIDPAQVRQANEALRKSQVNSSELQVELARKELQSPSPDIHKAIEKSLLALPDRETDPNRPVVKAAEATLFDALQHVSRPLWTEPSNSGGVTAVEFLAAPDRALIHRFGPRASVIDTRTGETVWQAETAIATGSPDGRFVAYADTSSAISAMDATTLAPLFKIAMPAGFGAIATIDISPDGKKIGVADGTNSFAFIFDATRPAAAPVKVEQPATLRINRLIFSPDSRRVLALGYLLYTARVFDASSGKQVAWLTGGHLATSPFGLIKTGAFSPDGKMIVTGATDSTARRWRDGRKLDPPLSTAGAPTVVSFAPDNSGRILTGTWQSTVQIWDSASGSEIAKVSSDGARLISAEYASDGAKILVTWSDGRAELLDADGKAVGRLGIANDGLAAAALSRDGSQILTGTGRGTVELWPVEARPELAVVAVKPDASGLAFAPDGKMSVAYGAAPPEVIALPVALSATRSEKSEKSVDDGNTAAPPRSIALGDAGTSAIIIDPTDNFTVAELKPSAGCRLRHPVVNAAGTLAAALCSDDTLRLWRIYPSVDDIVRDAKNTIADRAP